MTPKIFIIPESFAMESDLILVIPQEKGRLITNRKEESATIAMPVKNRHLAIGYFPRGFSF
ncbi:hypothetical protein PLESHI_03074 [Plesiomonas shigelloides 302-73]|uniref:Uncharacterized protein n=1 Tax=Plesiomonas shigelloides 302-73 TaxID=1315976 RepID=R8AU99_PLESH|nr:hypothetical protein PLESHI_03074 [Plesiomonas shigelloides 302-73]